MRRSRSRSCEVEFLPFYYKFFCCNAAVGAYDNEIGAVAPGGYIEHCGIPDIIFPSDTHRRFEIDFDYRMSGFVSKIE